MGIYFDSIARAVKVRTMDKQIKEIQLDPPITVTQLSDLEKAVRCKLPGIEFQIISYMVLASDTYGSPEESNKSYPFWQHVSNVDESIVN
jgi:hypothetical protein